LVKKLDISISSINLKGKFKDIHHAEIAGVSASAVDYAVLLNVWETE
jgi:hypothetical protein